VFEVERNASPESVPAYSSLAGMMSQSPLLVDAGDNLKVFPG